MMASGKNGMSCTKALKAALSQAWGRRRWQIEGFSKQASIALVCTVLVNRRYWEFTGG
jgi:hypothetical protein